MARSGAAPLSPRVEHGRALIPAIAIASCDFDREIEDPAALLERYHALEGWARALIQAGARAVTVVQRFRRDALLRRDGVEYRFVADDAPARVRPWFWGSRIAEVIRRLDPTVVHVDGLVFPMVVRHLRWKLPRPAAIVVQDHGGIHEGSPGFRSRRWRLGHRLGLRAADAFLFTARELAAPWSRAGVVGPDQMVHEVPESSTDLASALASPEGGRALPGRPALLWVGRLDANKDPLTVLAGFERTAAAMPDAALTMVFGDDRLLSEVRARIAASPVLSARVHLRGRLERRALAPLYDGADLFVLGSHHEGSGFALIEALSFGVTPIVTDIPAFRALTDGGRVGALYAPGDAEGLACAVERVGATDPDARRERVRAHFARELSWSAVGTKALAIYRAVSAARQARHG